MMSKNYTPTDNSSRKSTDSLVQKSQSLQKGSEQRDIKFVDILFSTFIFSGNRILLLPSLHSIDTPIDFTTNQASSLAPSIPISLVSNGAESCSVLSCSRQSPLSPVSDML